MTKDGASDCMNNLNSTLIEGTLTGDPLCRTRPNGILAGMFEIASRRCVCDEGASNKRIVEVSHFIIEVEGTLAVNVDKLGKKDRGVRVVGRLKEDRWQGAGGKQQSRVVIVAEHVEFRPMPKLDSTKKE